MSALGIIFGLLCVAQSTIGRDDDTVILWGFAGLAVTFGILGAVL